jgi:arylsulfatase A-like enzyme
LPNIEGDNNFIIETAIDWAREQLVSLSSPFLFYFHLLPPHAPYGTRKKYFNAFLDDLRWDTKPEHVFTNHHTPTKISNKRRQYDEFILYADAEFGRLYDRMEEQGILENSWVVFTSDHGEMFERGILYHVRPVLHQPVIRIPLLIHEPGQDSRRDIHSPTSAVDVLPTLLHGAGISIPDWIEGKVLPPFAQEEETRELFALEARQNAPLRPLEEATAMIVQWPYKLSAYWGYEALAGKKYYELYNLEEDPEELEELSTKAPEIFKELLGKLTEKISEADAPYK